MLETLTCPLPVQPAIVQVAHGGGGRLSRNLLESVFWNRLQPGGDRHDSAVVAVGNQRLAFTTDSYVVQPLFFPGGDIGTLAVYGTVNDLAMAGARALALSCGYILEEGLSIDTLHQVVASMQAAATGCGVPIVTGDTKVVDRGKGDGVFINTAGVGIIPEGVDIRPARVRPGDAILVSGDLGRHGIAILSIRASLCFDPPVLSDCAPLWPVVDSLEKRGVRLHCLRDLTRGGLAAALNEIAFDAGVEMEIEEPAVPVSESVASACEVLGLDPLYVANEGRLVAFVPGEEADRAMDAMREAGASPAAVGRVTGAGRGLVRVRGGLGEWRLLDLLSGEQLPRIC